MITHQLLKTHRNLSHMLASHEKELASEESNELCLSMLVPFEVDTDAELEGGGEVDGNVTKLKTAREKVAKRKRIISLITSRQDKLIEDLDGIETAPTHLSDDDDEFDHEEEEGEEGEDDEDEGMASL